MYHVFCGFHVMDNLGTYAEKPIYGCENIIEEQGKVRDDFKISPKSWTICLEFLKLLSKFHRHKKIENVIMADTFEK